MLPSKLDNTRPFIYEFLLNFKYTIDRENFIIECYSLSKLFKEYNTIAFNYTDLNPINYLIKKRNNDNLIKKSFDICKKLKISALLPDILYNHILNVCYTHFDKEIEINNFHGFCFINNIFN
jgi:hypothetical protein